MNYKKLIKNEKTTYIMVNLFTSFIDMLKVFIFMKLFNHLQLGNIGTFQTIISLIAIFQFGMLNGGYRIYSLRKKDLEITNNTIFSYIAFILFLAITSLVIIYFLNTKIDYILSSLAIISGILALLLNWLKNILIAKSKFKDVNKINLISSLLSFTSLLLIYFLDIYAVFLSFIIRPLTFIIMTFLKDKSTIPTKFTLRLEKITYILSFGFIPFLASIFILINTQIERWSIIKFLGKEQLGIFFLPILYSTLFLLVPNSLNSIFFPTMIRAYSNTEMKKFNKEIKNYFIILIAYCLIIPLLTYLFLNFFVTLIFPKHIISIQYVYYILPSLIFTVLAHPITTIFNASLKFKVMFTSYLFSSLIFIIIMLYLMVSKNINLTSISIFKSVSSFLTFTFIILGFFSIKKEIDLTQK